MNLLLLEPGEVTVHGRRARHLREVLGAAPGMTLRAGVLDGPLGTATVVTVTDDAIEVRFAASGPPPPGLPIELVLAVPRPKVLSRVVQTAAAFGVATIRLTRSWRVEKAYLASPRLEPDALALDCRLGAEQGGTTRLPAIVRHDRFMTMLDALPDPTAARRIVAHPTGVPVEAALSRGDASPLVCAIGPEGGWIERELATFVERDFTPVTIARPVLRVEAAVAALLGQIALVGRLTSS